MHISNVTFSVKESIFVPSFNMSSHQKKYDLNQTFNALELFMGISSSFYGLYS